MPTVTIAMPIHNRPTFLRDAIEGALAQRFADFELVISDSSTTSELADIVASYDDERIVYIPYPESGGPAQNWLNAVRSGRAPLMATLHDDDVWEPDFLAQVVPPMLDNPEVYISFADYRIIDGSGAELIDRTMTESQRSGRNTLPAGLVGHDLQERLRLGIVDNVAQPSYAAVIRREPILTFDFPDEIELIYDIWATYELIRAGGLMHYTAEPLTRYREHGNNLTSSGFGDAEDYFFSRVLEEQSAFPALCAAITERWTDLRWGRSTRYLRHGKYDDALREWSGIKGSVSRPRAAMIELGTRVRPALPALRAAKAAVGSTRDAANRLRHR